MRGCGHDKDIRDLSVQDLFGPTDIVPVYSGTNRDDRSVTGQAILNYVNANLVDPSAPMTQSGAPTTGQTVAIAPAIPGQSVRLLLQPATPLAALTIQLPGVGNAALQVDRQEISCTTTQTVTALTIAAGTTTVNLPVTTLAAGGIFKMFYDATTASWYNTR
jgi:hypothetical protein